WWVVTTLCSHTTAMMSRSVSDSLVSASARVRVRRYCAAYESCGTPRMRGSDFEEISFPEDGRERGVGLVMRAHLRLRLQAPCRSTHELAARHRQAWTSMKRVCVTWCCGPSRSPPGSRQQEAERPRLVHRLEAARVLVLPI